MAETTSEGAEAQTGRPALGGVERPIAATAASGPQVPALVSGRTYVAAVALSVVWIGLGAYLWHGTAPVGLVARGLALVSVILPLAMIWLLALSLGQLHRLRGERERLQMAMDQLRLQAANPPRPAPPPTPAASAEPAPKLTFQTRREAGLAPPPRTPVEEQPGLALGPLDDPGEPLSAEDFLRAVHFPDSPDDTRAYAALKLALADRLSSKLIQAAQDVLNLLAEDGIYMDDLAPDRARPELWRKFAAGERGRAIAALGGVRDRSCLALTSARMREDEIFRDVAHHFLRSFDKAFVAIEPRATDAQLSALSDTRTARAFMLFGRVTGTFD